MLECQGQLDTWPGNIFRFVPFLGDIFCGCQTADWPASCTVDLAHWAVYTKTGAGINK